MSTQRKNIVAEFISLDGVVESPEQWHMSFVDDELMGSIMALNARIDTMLLGRVTYESFAGAFAHVPADDPVAQLMNRPAKVVVSSTLGDPEWANSTVVTGDPAAIARDLKAQPGGDILTTGSITLTRALLRAGLVDELHLLVHPVVVGKGQRLFEADGPKLPLELVSNDVFGSGVVRAVYRAA